MFTAVYDEEGTEGRFAERQRPHLVPAAAAAVRADVPRSASRSTRRRSSRSTSPATTSSSRARRPGPTRCSATSARSTSATATTRSATPGTTASARWPAGATRSPGRSCAERFTRWRQWDCIAAAAHRPLHRQLAGHPGAGSAPTSGASRSVVYPPVDTDRFSPGPVGEHYVVLGELMPHKQIDVAIAAFNQLRLPLIVVGDGPAARGAAPPGRADDHVHRPGSRRDGGRAHAARRARWS